MGGSIMMTAQKNYSQGFDAQATAVALRRYGLLQAP